MRTRNIQLKTVSDHHLCHRILIILLTLYRYLYAVTNVFSSKALRPVTATPAHFPVGSVFLINGVNTLNLTHTRRILSVMQCVL